MKPECILKLKEQFKAEQMAFTSYEMIRNATDDLYLRDALDEIMYDEYLHAKFIRCFLMKMDAYDPSQHPDLEKIYMKMLNMDID